MNNYSPFHFSNFCKSIDIFKLKSLANIIWDTSWKSSVNKLNLWLDYNKIVSFFSNIMRLKDNVTFFEIESSASFKCPRVHQIVFIVSDIHSVKFVHKVPNKKGIFSGFWLVLVSKTSSQIQTKLFAIVKESLSSCPNPSRIIFPYTSTPIYSSSTIRISKFNSIGSLLNNPFCWNIWKFQIVIEIFSIGIKWLNDTNYFMIFSHIHSHKDF